MPESKSGALPLGYAPTMRPTAPATMSGIKAALAGRAQVIGKAEARQHRAVSN
jgi:hypothetical protein